MVIIQACQSNKIQYKSKLNYLSELPEAVSNNAVSLVSHNKAIELYSFNGLSSGKSYLDIHNKGFKYSNNQWQRLKTPHYFKNVLASTSVSIGDFIYLIGGYTVAEDHSEISTPEIYKLNTKTDIWSLETSMPIPVDDTVALVYKQRYIYLVSGWFDKDNVSQVQVYDTFEQKWFEATPFPAPAVFGHAGGIVNEQILICDGVKVVNYENKPREFVASSECWLGLISKLDPLNIEWEQIPHHSGTAYYRMAASGVSKNNRIVFAGGSDNPYNYDGIGYNKIPSSASDLLFSYNLGSKEWHFSQLKLPKNMDHRALLHDGEWFYIIGGMESNQLISNKVIRFKYE